MKEMTKARILELLKRSAACRYGKAHAQKLLPALRETGEAILAIRKQDLALEDEPAFFIRSNRPR